MVVKSPGFPIIPSRIIVVACLIGTLFLTAASLQFSFFIPATFRNTVTSATTVTAKRANGNPVAASDLYGLGVRVGLYLQSVGMLFSAARMHRKSGSGVKFLASVNIIAILSSWTVLVRNKVISPCEAWLVITLTSALTVPAWAALCNPYTVAGEGIGVFLLLGATEWNIIASLRFWAKSYAELPLLHTSNQAWMFKPVSMTGWFRVVMLVNYSISLLVSIPVIVVAIIIMGSASQAWLAGKITDGSVDENLVPFCKKLTYYVVFQGFSIFIGTIAGAEMIIKENGLSPATDLSHPGQAIPFVIGIIQLVDGLVSLVRPLGGGMDESRNLELQPTYN